MSRSCAAQSTRVEVTEQYLSNLSSIRGLGRSYFHKGSQDSSDSTVIRLRDEPPRNHGSIQSESKIFSCYPKQIFRPSGARCFLFSTVSVNGGMEEIA